MNLVVGPENVLVAVGAIDEEGTVECRAEARVEVDHVVHEALLRLAAKQLPEGCDFSQDAIFLRDHVNQTQGAIVGDFMLPFRALPQDVRRAAADFALLLSGAITQVLGMFMWRTGDARQHGSFRHGLAEWSSDGSSWHYLPAEFSGVVEGGLVLPLKLSSEASLYAAALAGEREPLAHELLREAALMASSNPRSSLLVAMTAAEVGVKHLLSHLQPQTDWLLENAPGPPLLKMLTRYLPTLSLGTVDGAGSPRLSSAGRSMLENAVTARNRLAHSGAFTADLREQLALVQFVRELLYVLDFHAGRAWVWPFVQCACSGNWFELVPPSERDRRIVPTVSLVLPAG